MYVHCTGYLQMIVSISEQEKQEDLLGDSSSRKVAIRLICGFSGYLFLLMWLVAALIDGAN